MNNTIQEVIYITICNGKLVCNAGELIKLTEKGLMISEHITSNDEGNIKWHKKNKLIPFNDGKNELLKVSSNGNDIYNKNKKLILS